MDKHNWIPGILALITVAAILLYDSLSGRAEARNADTKQTETGTALTQENIPEDIDLEFISVGNVNFTDSTGILNNSSFGDVFCETSTGNLYILHSSGHRFGICPVYRDDGQTVMNIRDFAKNKETDK